MRQAEEIVLDVRHDDLDSSYSEGKEYSIDRMRIISVPIVIKDNFGTGEHCTTLRMRAPVLLNVENFNRHEIFGDWMEA